MLMMIIMTQGKPLGMSSSRGRDILGRPKNCTQNSQLCFRLEKKDYFWFMFFDAPASFVLSMWVNNIFELVLV